MQPDHPWIVVYVVPQQEWRAMDGLTREGFDAYCPVSRKLVRRARMRKPVEVKRPAFPRYLFARVSPDRLDDALAVDGVAETVRVEGLTIRLPDVEVDRIRTLEASGAFDQLPRSKPVRHYRYGDLVLLSGGAFDGLRATVIRIPRRGKRIGVRAGHVTATVPVDAVEPAE